MSQFRLFGTAMLAVLSLSALLASSATALENAIALVLTGEKFPVAFEGTSGKSTTETVGGSKIECAAASSSGVIETERAGTASFTFKGCKSSGFGCNAKAEKAETVKLTGATLLVFDDLAILRGAILWTINEVTVECTALVKIVLKGNLLILHHLNLSTGQEVTEDILIINAAGGNPEDIAFWENGKEMKAKLEASINGGKFEQAGMTLLSNEIKFSKMIAFDF